MLKFIMHPRCGIICRQLLPALLTAVVATLAACAHSAPPSLADFTDQVIEPLAARVAEEKYLSTRGSIIAAGTPTRSYALLEQVPWLGSLMLWGAKSKKTQLETDLAWLETRRVPLKKELRELYVARTMRTSDGFEFCAEGIMRCYRIVDGARFSRLDEDPVPCEQTELHTLDRPGYAGRPVTH
jgi:hypothetical protein